MLGAAIMLPDHPADRAREPGSLFDSTEIEEALLLHVLALSRRGARGDRRAGPGGAARCSSARRETTPQELMDLHGRVTAGRTRARARRQAEVDGVIYRRGDTVVLPPGPPTRRRRTTWSTGAPATIERIYLDYDGTRAPRASPSTTTPARTLMRDIGRYLYFKTTEVEAA